MGYKEENDAITVEKPGTHQHDRLIKVNISIGGKYGLTSCMFRGDVLRRARHHSRDAPIKNV